MKYLTLPLLLIPLSTTSAISPDKKIEKYVDNVMRKEYYMSCREQRLKNCHMKAFEASIKYQFVEE